MSNTYLQSAHLRGRFLSATTSPFRTPYASSVSRRGRRDLRVYAGVVSSNNLKNGLTLEVNDQPWRVIEFLHVKPGKGAAFVRSKLKNCITGAVVDRTFRAGESLTTAEVQRIDAQFTYVDGDSYVFMDASTFEEYRVKKDEPWSKYLKEGSKAVLTFFQNAVITVEPPTTIELEVIEADAGVKGNTAQGGTHPVTLETGAVVTAPLFVQKGDVIRIDTKREVYLSRA